MGGGEVKIDLRWLVSAEAGKLNFHSELVLKKRRNIRSINSQLKKIRKSVKASVKANSCFTNFYYQYSFRHFFDFFGFLDPFY